jgi:hypothetical protein
VLNTRPGSKTSHDGPEEALFYVYRPRRRTLGQPSFLICEYVRDFNIDQQMFAEGRQQMSQVVFGNQACL